MAGYIDSLMSSSWSAWITAALIGVVSLLVYRWQQTQSKTKKASPTGHPTVPGLVPTHPESGNLPDVAAAGSLPQFLKALHSKHGPIVSFWFGKEMVISLASPGLFKQVAKFFNRTHGVFQVLLPLITKHAIKFTNGEDGRRRHTAYNRCYSDGTLKNYYDIFQELAEELVSKWTATIDEKKDIEEEMMAISIKAIAKASFGDFFNNEQEINAYYYNHMTSWNEQERQIATGPPEPGSERDVTYKKCIAAMHDAMRRAIRLREQSGASASGERLLIDVIIEVGETEEAKLGDAVNVFWGGFHTSGILLTWIFLYLAKYPEMQEKMYQEFMDVLGKDGRLDNESLEKLVYTKQVLDEALRHSTLVTHAARYNDYECELDGHLIPAKTPLIIAMSVVMEDENVWKDPLKFDPDRFSPANRKLIPAYAFEPFGFAGKRKCPGYKFDLISMPTYLSVILRKFKIKLTDDGNITKLHSMVPSPKEKVYLKAELRH